MKYKSYSYKCSTSYTLYTSSIPLLGLAGFAIVHVMQLILWMYFWQKLCQQFWDTGNWGYNYYINVKTPRLKRYHDYKILVAGYSLVYKLFSLFYKFIYISFIYQRFNILSISQRFLRVILPLSKSRQFTWNVHLIREFTPWSHLAIAQVGLF